MIKNIKKIIFVALVVSFLSFASFPTTASAQTYFGGMLTWYFKCTCDQNFYMFILDYASGSALRLVYSPGASILLAGSPFGTNQIGSYMPGAGICMMYAGTGCYNLQSDGLIGGGLPGFGTGGM